MTGWICGPNLGIGFPGSPTTSRSLKKPRGLLNPVAAQVEARRRAAWGRMVPNPGLRGTPLYLPSPAANHGIATRVPIFSVACAVFRLALTAASGQFRFDPRSTTRVQQRRPEGRELVRTPGSRSVRSKDPNWYRDGLSTWTSGSEPHAHRGHHARVGPVRELDRRPLPGARRRTRRGASCRRTARSCWTQTAPALGRRDALIGGFRLPFRVDLDQVNALSGELLKVFQGQGATISLGAGQTSALTTTLADARVDRAR